jgi:hypothetical protein
VRSGRALAARIAAALLAGGCVADAPAEAPAPPTASIAPDPAPGAPPVAFGWTDLRGRPLSTESVRGRITVLAFIATYDVASQAQARFLTALSHRHVPRLNVGLVVLEQPSNGPLVEAFVDSLGIEYPVAFADAATLAGHGPFEGLHHVPSVVVLDRQGRERARRLGLATERDLEALVREVEAAAR